MLKLTLIFLLVLASNAFGEGPIDQVDLSIETFKQYPANESSVFYQDNTIWVEITVTNNSSTDLDLKADYELDAAQGEFEAIQKTWESEEPVRAGKSVSFSDTFDISQNEQIASGTFIVKGKVSEANQGPGPENSVTGNSFITIFSGSGNSAPTSVDETSLFLLPITGFMALFLLRKKPSF